MTQAAQQIELAMQNVAGSAPRAQLGLHELERGLAAAAASYRAPNLRRAATTDALDYAPVAVDATA
jgi:hypothetical protein